MNQPTRDEHEELKRRVEKLEQQTEPIKITRLEIDSGSMHKSLDAVQEDTNVLKIEMQGARADIRVIKANQGDLLGYLENHSQRLESIEQKQDAHTEILGQIMNFGEEIKNTQDEHTKRFDRVEATMATKDDVASIKSDVSRLEGIMMQILSRLPKTEGEE